jgi:membrane-bound hydrogenase subunit mbhJ
MNLWNKLMCYCRRRSPWLFHMNAGSCNGCDIELIASLTPRYDAEQLGVRLEGSPRHADILCITGPVTHNSVQAIKTVYGQVCGPKAVVAIGSCPATTNVFIDSRTVDGPLNKHIPVDVFVPGCPPRPDAIILGIAKAAGILAERGAQKPAAAALAPTAPEAAALLTAAPEAIPTVPASAEPATPELVTVAAAAREVQP